MQVMYHKYILLQSNNSFHNVSFKKLQIISLFLMKYIYVCAFFSQIKSVPTATLSKIYPILIDLCWNMAYFPLLQSLPKIYIQSIAKMHICFINKKYSRLKSLVCTCQKRLYMTKHIKCNLDGETVR